MILINLKLNLPESFTFPDKKMLNKINSIETNVLLMILASLFFSLTANSPVQAGETNITRTRTGRYGGSRVIERSVEDGQINSTRTSTGRYGGSRVIERSVEDGQGTSSRTITSPSGGSRTIEHSR
ncbi:MAG: hypothetical protein AAGF26_01430 [Cyanobacteria bacterium P01_G01_bin.49]